MAESASSSLLIVISAPSGGGKTTLCQQLLAARPAMTRAITSTTRLPRLGERDGVDYYFFDPATFQRRIENGEFIENATVFGNQYGVLRNELLTKLRQGNDVLLNIDVQGATTIRAKSREDPELRRALVSVFLTPASLTELEARLRRRATDAEDVIQRRLSEARHELDQRHLFDYLLVSTTIPEDLRRMLIILEAEKMRTSHAALNF
jgi:guanylate kinase